MGEHRVVKVLVSSPLGIGGVTNMMINIQRHLDREKINFDYLVIHDRKEAMEDVVIGLGSKKLVASVDYIKFGPIRRLARINAIRKVCKDNNVKILHYNADSPADITNIIGAKLGGVKYITLHSHNAGFGNASMGIKVLSKILQPLTPTLCDNFWGCSDLAARFLFPKSIIDSGQYAVLPNGIELQKYKFNHEVRKQVREELQLTGKLVVGHVGRFSNQKNHAFLIDVFKEIKNINPNATLLLFGVGELMDLMKKKVKILGLKDSVIFYGSSNEMHRMWQAMDIFLMPSLHEGLPVTGIEAQASGLPCVFSSAITKEVGLTEHTEFISLEKDPVYWANRVLAYSNVERKDNLKILRDAGYDIQQSADMLANLYIKVSKELV